MIFLSRLLALYIAVLPPIAFAADLPEYCARLGDTERAQLVRLGFVMREGLYTVARIRPAVINYYETEGKWPATNAAAGLPAPDQYDGESFRSVTVLPDGRFVLVFNAQSGVDGGRVQLVPVTGRTLNWRCETSDYPLIKCAVPTCDYNPIPMAPVVTPLKSK
jgi:hypothetical protein